MKITYDPRIKTPYETARAKATADCWKCPICGETRKYWIGINTPKEDLGKGIIELGYRVHHKFRLFSIKTFRIDGFKCCTCGATWESDEYETPFG